MLLSSRRGESRLLPERMEAYTSVLFKRGAAIIAVAGIVLQLFVLYPYSQWGQPFSLLHLFTAFVSALFYASILLAQYKRQPRLYLPFLILNGIGILVLVVYSLILLMVLVLGGPDDEEGYGEIEASEVQREDQATSFGDSVSPSSSPPLIAQKHWHTSSGAHAMHIRHEILHLLLMLWASAVVSIFFQWVVYRAWKWMKLECGSGPLATTYTVAATPTNNNANNASGGENSAVIVSTPGGGIVNIGFIDPNASAKSAHQLEQGSEKSV